jgi:dihydrofolate reductase
MGRRTWESKEIAGKPLPRRLNSVLSRGPLAVPEGVVAARSIDDAIAKRGDAEEVFVIGGAEIFAALGHAALRHVYLTRVEGRFGCDAHIPDLEVTFGVDDPTWATAVHVESDVRFRIQRLVRRRP